MSWIKTIDFKEATGRLATLYERVKGPDNNVDNIMMAHSLRPHTMEGHMAIYKYVLHHSGNEVPKWFLETIGVWVSVLNQCDYCIEHHFKGLQRLLGDEARAGAIRFALEESAKNKSEIGVIPLHEAQKQALNYARLLTLSPASLTSTHIQTLRDQGFSDGEILEINQVAAYFSYANRTVLGLGVSLKGDEIGLSPNNSNNPDDWNHR